MINEILKMMRRSKDDAGNQCSCVRHSELLKLGLRTSLARFFGCAEGSR